MPLPLAVPVELEQLNYFKGEEEPRFFHGSRGTLRPGLSHLHRICKKKTGHYNSCSPTLQLSNISACARPRRTVSDLAVADGVAKLYGHVCGWWSWWCTVRGRGGLSIGKRFVRCYFEAPGWGM